MALKHMQAKLQQQHAVLAKEVQDLKETLEVRNVAWSWEAGRSETSTWWYSGEVSDYGLEKASVPRALIFPT